MDGFSDAWRNLIGKSEENVFGCSGEFMGSLKVNHRSLYEMVFSIEPKISVVYLVVYLYF